MASLSDVRVKRKISCQYHIIISMMCGHGPNPIFFNKKNKDWTSRALAKPPTPLHPITSNFCLSTSNSSTVVFIINFQNKVFAEHLRYPVCFLRRFEFLFLYIKFLDLTETSSAFPVFLFYCF